MLVFHFIDSPYWGKSVEKGFYTPPPYSMWAYTQNIILNANFSDYLLAQPELYILHISDKKAKAQLLSTEIAGQYQLRGSLPLSAIIDVSMINVLDGKLLWAESDFRLIE